jgi:hypothetical protein
VRVDMTFSNSEGSVGISPSRGTRLLSERLWIQFPLSRRSPLCGLKGGREWCVRDWNSRHAGAISRVRGFDVVGADASAMADGVHDRVCSGQQHRTV